MILDLRQVIPQGFYDVSPVAFSQGVYGAERKDEEYQCGRKADPSQRHGKCDVDENPARNIEYERYRAERKKHSASEASDRIARALTDYHLAEHHIVHSHRS